MSEKYRPPVEPETFTQIPEQKPEPKEYTPPVGPGSKSLPPVGNHRDIHPDLTKPPKRK